jgi:CBS domain-containing protein
MYRNVEEVMQKDVVTVTPETSVRELIRILVSSQISGVPVVSDGGEIVGVVSTTDVVRLGAKEAEVSQGNPTWEPLVVPPEEREDDFTAPYFALSEDWMYGGDEEAGPGSQGVFEGFTVGDIMTSAAFTVEPDDSVEEVAKFLLKGRIHRALVVEKGQLLGIVTTFDLLRVWVGD